MARIPARALAVAAAAAAFLTGGAIAGATMAAADDELLPRDGRSLGGNWRAAPSVDGARIGGLAEGTRLRILENAGATFNGYDWFAVEVNGRRGFQWGGILCADGAVIPGLLEACAGTAQARPPTPPPDLPDVPETVRTATAAFDGEWTLIGADIHGMRPGSCVPGSDTVLTVTAGNFLFNEARCTLSEAAAADRGVRVTGMCSGENETWPFDNLAFVSEGGGLLVLVDQSGTRPAGLQVYRGCWLPE